MMKSRHTAIALFALSAGLTPPAVAQPAEGWKDAADFSFVSTNGNSESQSLGFKNKLWRRWEKSAFELNAGGIRVETTNVSRLFAVCPANDGVTCTDLDSARITRETASELTAENYYLNGRYDREVRPGFLWFAGAGWDRNEFAGIANRYTGFGGVGNLWADKDKLKWRTDYSLSITQQDDVVEDPEVDDSFLGLRLSSTLLYKFSEGGSYGNDTVVDENFDETEDLRINMTNWVAVSMTDHLALKVSLQWLFDNLPAKEEAAVFTADPDLGGGVSLAGGPVLRELDDLDTIVTASLVVNF